SRGARAGRASRGAGGSPGRGSPGRRHGRPGARRERHTGRARRRSARGDRRSWRSFRRRRKSAADEPHFPVAHLNIEGEARGARGGTDFGGLLFHELLESVKSETRDVLAGLCARRAVPLEEGPDTAPPEAFYGTRGPRVGTGRGGGLLRRPPEGRGPDRAAAFLPGDQPLLPQLRDGGEAALDRLQAKPLSRLLDGDIADPAKDLLDLLAGRNRRHLQLAREETLVVHPKRRQALLEEVEVLRDRDGHPRKVVYIRRAWIRRPHSLPPWTASSRAIPGGFWSPVTGEPARKKLSVRRPRAGARGVPRAPVRPTSSWPPPPAPSTPGPRPGRAASSTRREFSCTRTSGAPRSPMRPSRRPAAPPDSRRSNTTWRKERAEGAGSTSGRSCSRSLLRGGTTSTPSSSRMPPRRSSLPSIRSRTGREWRSREESSSQSAATSACPRSSPKAAPRSTREAPRTGRRPQTTRRRSRPVRAPCSRSVPRTTASWGSRKRSIYGRSRPSRTAAAHS